MDSLCHICRSKRPVTLNEELLFICERAPHSKTNWPLAPNGLPALISTGLPPEKFCRSFMPVNSAEGCETCANSVLQEDGALMLCELHNTAKLNNTDHCCTDFAARE